LRKRINANLTASPANKLAFAKKELADYFRDHFGNKDLDGADSKFPEFIRILGQAKGACRHRALLYMTICQYLGLPAQVIRNEVHEFAELKVNKELKVIDLGGHPSVINSSKITEPDYADLPPPPKPSRPTITTDYKAYFSPIHSDAKTTAPDTTDQVLHHLLQRKNTMLPINNLAEGRGIYTALHHLAKQQGIPVIYLEAAQQIEEDWQAITVSPEGVLQSSAGPLQELLSSKKPAIVMINWGGAFDATETAAYMSINDTRPLLKGLPISDQVKVINLVTPALQNSLGDRFFSRSPEWPWPAAVPRMTASPIPTSKKESKQTTASSETLTIDLYQGAIDWQKLLIGDIEPTDTGFRYVRGALEQALSKNPAVKSIQLVDVPQQDADFQRFMLKLQVTGYFISNGRKIILPDNFLSIAPAAPKRKKESKTMSQSIAAWLSEPTEDLPEKPVGSIAPTAREIKKESKTMRERISSWLSETTETLPEKPLDSIAPAVQESKRESKSREASVQPSHAVEVVYVNRSNFLNLFSQQIVAASGRLAIAPGWLTSAKRIVITDKLLPGQLRYLEDQLAQIEFPPRD